MPPNIVSALYFQWPLMSFRCIHLEAPAPLRLFGRHLGDYHDALRSSLKKPSHYSAVSTARRAYAALLISSLAAAHSIASASASGQRQINVSERLEARRFSASIANAILVLRHV
jgi:hypothetical protein